jgi:hypothetical protein
MFDIGEVEYEVECLVEDMPIRGNCMASGDDVVDEDCAKEIESRLADGNDWAWCCVKVTARWHTFESTEYLGGCSYEDEEDFRKGGYFEDMQDEALHILTNQIVAPWAA